MALVETYKGYGIYTALAATTSSIATTSGAFRVVDPKGATVGTKPLKTIEDARKLVDAAIAKANPPKQEYILARGSNGEQDVYSNTTHRQKVGSIGFIDLNRHEALDVDRNSLGEFPGGNEAKDAVIDAYEGR